MDRLVAALRSFRSNSESVMNGMCGVLALASVRLYSALPLRCPCVPGYNALYGASMLLLPAATLFLCGVALNRRWLLLLREWRRPEGGRPRDRAALRYLLLGVVRGAALPPAAWIIVALLDGKCVACPSPPTWNPAASPMSAATPRPSCAPPWRAFPAETSPPGPWPDPRPSPGRWPTAQRCRGRGGAETGVSSLEQKDPGRFQGPGGSGSRGLEKALGWTTLFLLILWAFFARSLRPCSPHDSFLQSWYWGNYLDLEQKVFEDMCLEHAQALAQRSVSQFFLSAQSSPGERGERRPSICTASPTKTS
ncbi:calcium homeostasis modulator protein 3-like [Pristis pectinata]|uniref:calcium homeostasis modulator protein 3-like n=1 Tax=Pristis pectinata TaxID=685728 RepID=UPI00223CB980|nr:calcium homeostasis modulator protein 3-like [Pristis pectinata]